MKGMKKELVIKMVISDGVTLGSIVHKEGFKDDLDSSFQIVGMLQKLVRDEQDKLDNKLRLDKKFIIDGEGNTDGF